MRRVAKGKRVYSMEMKKRIYTIKQKRGAYEVSASDFGPFKKPSLLETVRFIKNVDEYIGEPAK